uniref:Uncharacterized protein n=1 Tax=Romanomermis culicivorax TaxID=13658 RepID=A0A915KZG7_ROMCU
MIGLMYYHSKYSGLIPSDGFSLQLILLRFVNLQTSSISKRFSIPKKCLRRNVRIALNAYCRIKLNHLSRTRANSFQIIKNLRDLRVEITLFVRKYCLISILEITAFKFKLWLDGTVPLPTTGTPRQFCIYMLNKSLMVDDSFSFILECFFIQLETALFEAERNEVIILILSTILYVDVNFGVKFFVCSLAVDF